MEITYSQFIKQIQNHYSIHSHGLIWKVKSGFTVELKHTAVWIKDNKVMSEKFEEKDYIAYATKYIEEGSLIEFRYEYDAHCRDALTGDYWRIDPSILAIKCEPFGRIEEKTRFMNKLDLKEILEQKLYTKIEFKKESES